MHYQQNSLLPNQKQMILSTSDTIVTVKVPGKIMLSGEYAILAGKACIAATVNQFMTIHIAPNPNGFYLESALWPKPRMAKTKEPLDPQNPFEASVTFAAQRLGLEGASIMVDDGINPHYGFGSSSALRLGVMIGLAILHHLQGDASAKPLISDPQKLLWEWARLAWLQQRGSQGAASGYDFITQVSGGFVQINPLEPVTDSSWPGHIQRITPQNPIDPWLHILVGSQGNCTSTTIVSTQDTLKSLGLWKPLLAAMDALTSEVYLCLNFSSDQNLQKTSQSLDLHPLIAAIVRVRNILSQSPSYPQNVHEILCKLPGFDQSWTYKTSGAGGSDALILIGSLSDIEPAISALKGLGWHYFSQGFSSKSVSWQIQNGTFHEHCAYN